MEEYINIRLKDLYFGHDKNWERNGIGPNSTGYDHFKHRLQMES